MVTIYSAVLPVAFEVGSLLYPDPASTTRGGEAIAPNRPVHPVVIPAMDMAYPAYFTPFAAKASIPLAPYGRLRFCVDGARCYPGVR